MYTFMAAGTFGFTGRAAAEGVRITPKSFSVKNDSLHIYLEMDLNSVHANSLTAVLFTPELKATRGNQSWVPLPPVIITGGKRYRYERRERALAAGNKRPETPFLVLLDNKRTGSKTVAYRVSVPYAAWMQQATLLLRQEIKNCCDLQLLGVDTLAKRITLTGETTQIAAAAPVAAPSLHAEPQKGKPAIIATGIPAAPRPTQGQALFPVKDSDTHASKVDFASMLTYLRPESNPAGKRHIENAVLYIDYPLGKDEVYPDYKNNRKEIDKTDAILYPLLSDGFSELERIRIRGYASPDGPYGENDKLSANRSHLFADYVKRAYNIPSRLFEVSSVAEDWDGLEELLAQAKPAYHSAVLDIIRRYGIFGGREKHLMDLQGGAPYKDMLRRFFPRLRRIEIVVEYRIRKFNEGETAGLIYTHPDLMSLEEMYGVARYYRPGTDQYREVYEIAAFHFPSEVVANVNAASAVMLTGDLISAWEYLHKVEADPRSWNNIGVLTLMEGNPEGAAVWFRKAVGIEPRKARQNLEIALSYINEGDE